MSGDLLVRAAAVRFDETAPTEPAAVQAMAAYFAEIGDRFGFEPGATGDSDDTTMGPPDGAFFVGSLDGEPVVCGGWHPLEAGVVEIKRMWVRADLRGAGLGGRMLRHLEAEATRRGHHTVRLDTHSSLAEAVAMYERSGYRAIDRYNDNPWARRWFEKQL